VLQGVHSFEDKLALRGQPVAALPEVALPIGAHHTGKSMTTRRKAYLKPKAYLRPKAYLKKAIPSSGMSSGRALAQRSTSSGVTTFFRWADM
jgi:hypothetical protein